MRSCTWHKMRDSLEINSKIYPFLGQRWISDEELIEAIRSESFYGIAKVDLMTPPEIIAEYEHLNFPVIFRLFSQFLRVCLLYNFLRKLNVEEEMLDPSILEKAKSQGRTFPYETRTLTWSAEEIILVTPLLRRYLQLGLKITKVYYAIQYAPTKPFDLFVDELVEERIKYNKVNDARSDRAKFTLNSACGRFGLNLERQRKTKFALEENLQQNVRSPLVERYHELHGEYQTGIFEIIKKKSKITDKIPVQCSLAIYQLSKLHFLDFVIVLHKYLRPLSFRLVYADTDSLMLSMSGDTLDDLVREDKLDDWKTNVYPKWFADPEDRRQQKLPGLLKSEFRTQNGSMCALSPKCYMITDDTQNRIKKSTKGTPRSTKLTLAAYEKALFDGIVPKTSFNQITADKKLGSAVTKSVTKKAINPIYLKMRVSANLVDISPFKKNDKFV